MLVRHAGLEVERSIRLSVRMRSENMTVLSPRSRTSSAVPLSRMMVTVSVTASAQGVCGSFGAGGQDFAQVGGRSSVKEAVSAYLTVRRSLRARRRCAARQASWTRRRPR